MCHSTTARLLGDSAEHRQLLADATAEFKDLKGIFERLPLDYPYTCKLQQWGLTRTGHVCMCAGSG